MKWILKGPHRDGVTQHLEVDADEVATLPSGSTMFIRQPRIEGNPPQVVVIMPSDWIAYRPEAVTCG